MAEYPHRHGHGHGRRGGGDDDSDDRRRHAPAYGHQDPYDAAPPSYGRPAADPYDAPPPSYGRPPADPYGRAPPAYGGGRDDDDGGYGRRAPPPSYGREDDGGYGGRAPPPAYGHGGRDDDGGYGGGRAPAPAYGNVVHVSHESGEEDRPHYGGGSGYGHETRPHHGGGGGGGAAPVRQQTFRIVCKAGEAGFSLAARDGKVCLVRTDRDDDAQHWIKDMKYSTRVKDEEGYPAIALVNKATGEALKHSLGQSHPVRLASYNPEYMDESVLWTESRDVGEGYRCIRMVNNIYLNFDALHGDKDHGGVRDGTTLVLWEWCEGDNQRWKIVAW
ncbi:ricin B-like lectin R40G3 [Brachypodium distachyon]|uniref:PH domain-containing protein n=1 Tax=Brachypodium distachyon TaxID=15368 RepID=I1HC41_BRADI|nr:ricin B-like lectin R40G3 [Brachypodium distachyon]KQK02752.1 hypothetical protein BRADI_2g03460v3 [Brachypodium distachyon]|eukprot:XP_003565351.1 ricin B-like lectin R40G3 [Brachypodium distachyon]